MDKQLSIVIISMNNVRDLVKCIDSIYRYNDSELFNLHLVAFNFTDKNLELINSLYSKIKIHRTEGIKGFSENNNIALKQIKSKFCLILNDDTYFEDNSIEKLLDCMSDHPSIKILSPHILNIDNSSQLLGRPRLTVLSYILYQFKLINWLPVGNTQLELFQTYNISGACFMIDVDYFHQLGLFDEKYFFTPEDVALSTKSYRGGIFPYVLKQATVFHISSSTCKKIHQITIPVSKQGAYLFFREFYGFYAELCVRVSVFFISLFKWCYWSFMPSTERKTIMKEAARNCLITSFRRVETKALFSVLHSKYFNS